MNSHNEKPFKQLWSELRKAGWNSRKPMGLNNNNTYIKPGVSGPLVKQNVELTTLLECMFSAFDCTY
ncbi:hypothetical protein GQ600_13553 [Phytophthora cactorum]|nr:hypothetical protein GQ600_13553 [Phytophthora cactorum]